MTTTRTAAEIVARRLHDAGCRHAFGIPGGEVVTLVDALEHAGLAFHLTKHESGAGFMAEGAWHMTGAPAVLVATIGPGAANAVNVVANAWQDRTPMIVLTGCVEAAEAVTYTHQVFDHQAMFRPIAKASFRLVDGAVAETIDKALAIAAGGNGDGRAGPVHIDVPIQLARRPQSVVEGAPRRVPNSPTGPAPGPDLERAREWLAEAERPLAVAGLDVLQHGAADDLAAFCRRFGAPLITTYKAKGVLPEDDPLALGGAGLSPTADALLKPVLDAADLILAVGYDPIEMRTGWRQPWDSTTRRVIEIAAEGNTHFMHQASLSFVCDVKAGLVTLGDGVAARDSTWSDGTPAKARKGLDGAFGQREDWGPAAAILSARAALPKTAVATVDSGAHRILLSQIWNCYGPRQLLQSTGLCTMGCALPLAIGAKLTAPETPVVCFTGDAGLEMVLGELASARELETPIIVVVFVDASLALIEMKQRGEGYGNAGVDFGETDFVRLADALGGHGVAVESRDAMQTAIADALDADRFTVIAAKIPRKSYDGRL